MERLACVDFPVLPLQILLESNPGWAGHPVVVVDRDTSQGTILYVNRVAWAHEIRPGMRFAAGQSLDSDLRAGVVEQSKVDAVVTLLLRHLQLFSPHVEPSTTNPGTFWLRVAGLDRFFGTFVKWCESLYDETRELGYHASITVGFGRFETFATSVSSAAGWRIFDEVEDERGYASRIRLDMLGIEPDAIKMLSKLGIDTVGKLVELPPSGVRQRFGAQVAELWMLATHNLNIPVQSAGFDDPVQTFIDFEEPEWSSTRMLFCFRNELRNLLLRLGNRFQDLRELQITLHLEDGDERELTVRPANPCLDEPKIVDLLRLRLDALSLPAAVTRAQLNAEGIDYRREQVTLDSCDSRRDLWAANHALAQLKSEHGDSAVCIAMLTGEHLPESQYRLEPLEKLEPARPRQGKNTVVRRIHSRPKPLPYFESEPIPGWLIDELDAGVATKFDGPDVISTGWWSRVRARDYWFATTTRNDVFWLFYDRIRQQWFLHGHVE